MKSGVAAGALASVAGPAASMAKRGGRLRLGLNGANTSDSWDGRTHSDIYMISMAHGCVFDCLTQVTAEGNLEGELAESWDVSKDAKVWTFKLRRGVEFHNGKRFGADDVIESLMMHTAPNAKSAAKPIVDNVQDMKKLGDYEVRLTLKSGNADFAYLMSDYHILMYPAGNVANAIKDGIGTGLYRVKSFDPGVRFVGERVKSHYKGDSVGFFDEIEAIAINDSSARMNALMTGQVDVVNRVDFKIERLLRANPTIDVFEVTGNQHYTLPMLTKVSPFDNVNVRRALKHAINREELVDKILQGHGAVGNDHPIGPANQYYAADLPQNSYDPDKAKHYLKKAGMSSLDVDLSISDAAFTGAVDSGELYRASAKKAGININVVKEPADGYWSNVWLKKPFCASYWSGRATEDWMFSTAYEAGVPWNDTQWDHSRFQKLLFEGRTELDSRKRGDIYHEMQKILSEDGGVIVPMYANYVAAANKKLAHKSTIGNLWQLDNGRIAERWWFS